MPEKIRDTILEDGINEKDLENLKEWGAYLAPISKNDRAALTTSQLRKFFGEIKRIQSDFLKNSGDIILLDPKLAYAVGRTKSPNNPNPRILEFYNLLKPLISNIKKEPKKFVNFVKTLECIVSYHKENAKDEN